MIAALYIKKQAFCLPVNFTTKTDNQVTAGFNG